MIIFQKRFWKRTVQQIRNAGPDCGIAMIENVLLAVVKWERDNIPPLVQLRRHRALSQTIVWHRSQEAPMLDPFCGIQKSAGGCQRELGIELDLA